MIKCIGVRARLGLVLGFFGFLTVVACTDDEESSVSSEAVCSQSVFISAKGSREETSSGVKIVGAVQVDNGVTVQAVYVAGQKVTQKEFNFRAWTIDIPQDVLVAHAVDGVASLPVQAYTTIGCGELSEREEPKVLVTSAGGAGGAGGADNMGGASSE